MKAPVIEIRKTKAKQPFRVLEFATNGEQTGPGENYANRQGIKKVLKFRLKLYNGIFVRVRDYSYRGESRKYLFYADGTTQPATF